MSHSNRGKSYYKDDSNLASDQEVMIYLDTPQLDREAGLIRFWIKMPKTIRILLILGSFWSVSPIFSWIQRELINLQIN